MTRNARSYVPAGGGGGSTPGTLPRRAIASSMNLAMSSSAKVIVSFSTWPIDSDQRARRGADAREGLDDEAVGRLDDEDVAHAALVEVGADRAKDLLEVLARASVVDPHRVSVAASRGSLEVRSPSSGRTGRLVSPAGR